MASALARRIGPARKGFSLMELCVVAAIAGLLAACLLPRLIARHEREKANQAFEYLATVRSAQEVFRSSHGTYSSELAALDMTRTPPAYFDHDSRFVAVGGGEPKDSWQMTLKRAGALYGFGSYNVTFNHAGFDEITSDIPATIRPNHPLGDSGVNRATADDALALR